MIFETQDISYVYTGLVLNEAWIGALIAGLAAVTASVVGAFSQRRTNKKNRELAEYQYSKDVEMWEKNNEYNSPESQMDRYQQAGLNPNLVYGSPAVSGNSTSMPSYDSPELDAYTDFGDFGASSAVNAYYQEQQQKNSDKLAESNYELQKTQAAVNRIEAINKFIESKGKVIDNLEKLRTHNYNKSVEGILRDGLVKANNKTDKEIDLIQSNIDVNHGRMNLMQRQSEELQSRINVNEKQADYIVQQTEESVARTSRIWQLLPSEVKYSESNAENMKRVCYNSLIKNENDKVVFNQNRFKYYFMKVFGCEPGANALSFISSLSSSLASKVMSLGDNYSAR